MEHTEPGTQDLVGIKRALKRLGRHTDELDDSLGEWARLEGDEPQEFGVLSEARELLESLGDQERRKISPLRTDRTKQDQSLSSNDDSMISPDRPIRGKRTLAELLDRFRHLRTRSVDVLQAFREEDWLRVILLPNQEARTVAEFVRRWSYADSQLIENWLQRLQGP
jgi:hypothetical protein